MGSEVPSGVRRLFEMVSSALADVARDFSGERRLEYPSNATASASALVSCPEKWRLRNEYGEPPQDAMESPGVQDGFFWERVAKEALQRAVSQVRNLRCAIEPAFTCKDPLQKGGVVVAHPDAAVLSARSALMTVEMKSVSMMRLPPGQEVENLVFVPEDQFTLRHYVLQSKVQQYVTRKHLAATGADHLKVTGVVFVRGATFRYAGQNNRKLHRVYAVVHVSDTLTDEQFRTLMRYWHDEDLRGPRYPWECRYCPWRGVCQGRPVRPLPAELTGEVPQDDLDSAVDEALSKYFSLQEELNQVKAYLRDLLRNRPPRVKDGRVTGHVKRVWTDYDPLEVAKAVVEADDRDLAGRVLQVQNKELEKAMSEGRIVLPEGAAVQREIEQFVFHRRLETLTGLLDELDSSEEPSESPEEVLFEEEVLEDHEDTKDPDGDSPGDGSGGGAPPPPGTRRRLK